MKGKCESCEEEKEVTEIEGSLLCADCAEEIVRCDNCHTFLGINYDVLEADNFGNLSVPKLHLPKYQTNLIFCDIDCLAEFVQKEKEKEMK